MALLWPLVVGLPLVLCIESRDKRLRRKWAKKVSEYLVELELITPAETIIVSREHQQLLKLVRHPWL
jgi:hypothetical protein